jgi:IclR family transcriptional regulator, acetate operon repressor
MERRQEGVHVTEPVRKAVSGTVARTVRILRFLGEKKMTTIREASAALMLAPSTVHRLFDLLAREGMIEQDKSERSYRAGAEFFRIAAQIVGRYDLRTIALPIMREVVAACEETCVLGLYLPTLHKITFAERVDSILLLRYQLPMNIHLSLLSGASGRSILAFLPPDQIELILQEERAGSKKATASQADLVRELKTIRKRGFAVSHGEMISGAMAFAAPVIGAEGWAIASIGVTAPNERMQRVGMRRVSALLLEKARELSLRLGAPAPAPAQARPPLSRGVAPGSHSRGGNKRLRRSPA